MQYLLLGLAALVLGLLILEGQRGGNAGIWMRRFRISVGILVLAASAGLFVRGAAGPASMLAMVGMWLVTAPGSGFLGVPGNSQKTPGQSSAILTEHLQVELDHDTGQVTGQIIKGPFAGHTIETLTVRELADLWQAWQNSDPQSAHVVEAILDGRYAGWRDDHAQEDDTGAGGTQHQGSHESGGSTDDVMTRARGYEILGLKPGASGEEIRAAHRQLMQKIHPDHGGSTYLASQINRAKDVLLG